MIPTNDYDVVIEYAILVCGTNVTMLKWTYHSECSIEIVETIVIEN